MIRKAFIYKIVCDTGLTYFGSTFNNLDKRLYQHKYNFQRWKEGKYAYLSSFKVLENENYKIIAVEEVDVNDKRELHERERFYIENFECVNRNVPLRTRKEYYQSNKERIAKYYQDNKDRIAKYYQDNREKKVQYQRDYIKKYKSKLNATD